MAGESFESRSDVPTEVTATSQRMDPSLPPPLKRKRMVIDSRSRDLVAYPTPAKYEVQLDEDLFNVAAVNLIVADVPFPAFLIGPGRRTVPFSFSDGATVVANALLPVGDYASPEDLATELGAAMTAAAAAAAAASGQLLPTFAATYVARTDGFSISGTVPFSLLFSGRATDAPAAVLGFGSARDYPSAPDVGAGGGHAITSPFRRDFRTDRYVVLKLSPNAEVITSVTQALDRTFAVVPRAEDCLNINADADGFEKRWTPPLSRVGRILVQFTDGDGNPYDFQNQDHRLELVFEIVAQRAFSPM